MNKIERLVVYVMFLMAVLWTPASSLAQSPFDGTWRNDMDQYKPSPKPIVFSLNKGMYDCSSCSPKIHVKADGQDQPVTGQSYDTLSVREVDSKSIATTTKKNGKTAAEQTRVLSPDGNTLTLKVTSHPPDSGQPVTAEVSYTRVGKAPAGAHAASGSWRLAKVKESENGLTTTYKSGSGGELSMSQPTGESYTAKLDGKDYPAKGSYIFNSVSLKRVDDHTIEETDKRDGKVIGVAKMTVAPDGKKMTVVYTNKLTGRVSTSVAEKQ
jgi:GH15 family glucan-1,4-alpha-glucosidase